MSQTDYFHNIDDLETGIKRVLGRVYQQEFFVVSRQCFP